MLDDVVDGIDIDAGAGAGDDVKVGKEELPINMGPELDVEMVEG